MAVIRRVENRPVRLSTTRFDYFRTGPKGTVKEAIGKVTGDAKLETEGKADKVQNAIGGVKDAVRDALKK
jgi:hypothetical protein